MNIGIIGAGRLGICFALLLDRGGYQVRACDIRSNYIAGLQRREISTTEPGVADMLSTCSIDFTTDTRRVIQESDVIYVMVATPSRADGSYDISAVERVVADVTESDFDISGKILVIGCTTNPGDCQSIQNQLRSRHVSVLYNPEFIAQGTILRDLEAADMVLIGGEDAEVIARYQTVYDQIQPDRQPCIHSMSLTAAELVKIATNCFLTTKIAYANMLGEVLIRQGLEDDVDRALTAVGADSRVGAKYMRYGLGYGGPCLPRDNRAFAHTAHQAGLTFPLGTIVDQFNQDHTEFVANHLMSTNSTDQAFLFTHLSYKPATDIFEESQPLRLAEILLGAGRQVWLAPDTLTPNTIIERLHGQFPNTFRVLAQEEVASPDLSCVRVRL